MTTTPVIPVHSYDVFVFTVVKVKVAAIGAATPEQAIEIAEAVVSDQEERLFRKQFKDAGNGEIEYAESAQENAYFLVDRKEQGDNVQSDWYSGAMQLAGAPSAYPPSEAPVVVTPQSVAAPVRPPTRLLQRDDPALPEKYGF